MFLYRLTTNNRYRMLLAVFLAIAVHIVFMNFKLAPKAVFSPSVLLPQSVTVFLHQGKIVEMPVTHNEKRQETEPLPEKEPRAAAETLKSFSPKVFAAAKIKDNQLTQQELHEKTVKPPVVENIVPATQKPLVLNNDLLPRPGSAVKVEESLTLQELQAADEKDGATLPGTMQLAYPRYQLNTPPAYPALARKRKQEGTVILQVLVNKKGWVDELEIETSSGFRLLDRAAVIAVRKWIFEPGQQGEDKLDMWVKVPVTFQLQ